MPSAFAKSAAGPASVRAASQGPGGLVVPLQSRSQSLPGRFTFPTSQGGHAPPLLLPLPPPLLLLPLPPPLPELLPPPEPLPPPLLVLEPPPEPPLLPPPEPELLAPPELLPLLAPPSREPPSGLLAPLQPTEIARKTRLMEGGTRMRAE
jgi:hypothetical protein